jgi:hypothetical protein
MIDVKGLKGEDQGLIWCSNSLVVNFILIFMTKTR